MQSSQPKETFNPLGILPDDVDQVPDKGIRSLTFVIVVPVHVPTDESPRPTVRFRKVTQRAYIGIEGIEFILLGYWVGRCPREMVTRNRQIVLLPVYFYPWAFLRSLGFCQLPVE
jgi:hypothetical protein